LLAVASTDQNKIIPASPGANITTFFDTIDTFDTLGIWKKLNLMY